MVDTSESLEEYMAGSLIYSDYKNVSSGQVYACTKDHQCRSFFKLVSIESPPRTN